MVLMRRGESHFLHLINLSGHTDIAYFDPVPMANIRIQLAGSFRKARAVVSNGSVPIARKREVSELVLPELAQYEIIVLE
jgi:hypothetical protein